jgi:hypothetical protein
MKRGNIVLLQMQIVCLSMKLFKPKCLHRYVCCDHPLDIRDNHNENNGHRLITYPDMYVCTLL